MSARESEWNCIQNNEEEEEAQEQEQEAWIIKVCCLEHQYIRRFDILYFNVETHSLFQ